MEKGEVREGGDEEGVKKGRKRKVSPVYDGRDVKRGREIQRQVEIKVKIDEDREVEDRKGVKRGRERVRTHEDRKETRRCRS